MTSLKWRLLAWLLPFYLLSATLAVGISYMQYQASVAASMDGQMHALALSYVQGSDGGKSPILRPLNEEQVEQHGTGIVQFWSRDGHLLASSWPVAGLMLQADEGFRTLAIAGHHWRVYTAVPGPLRVQVVQSGDFRRQVIFDLALRAAEPVALLFPLTAVLLWLAVFLALRPMDRLVQSITRQDERNLAELPFDKVPRELLPLIGSMNSLLLRLKEAFATQQRFVQDAAHELRTPLTALKLQTENLRHMLGGSADTEIARLEAGIERMQRLVEQLLKLAHQEVAATGSERTTVDLQEALKESVSGLITLAEARKIDLGFTASEPAEVRADAGSLRSVFDNLLDNALRYTPAGGRVDVSLRRVHGTVFVEFLDTGPGIPPELLERVFDRFYRVLGNGAQGSGLGLAIARTAAGHGDMRIELLNRGDRSGLLARVRFS
jgi:two-component system OmpR family sensor kinase